MTTAQLHTHIIHMQNLYGTFVQEKYVNKLKIGKICKEAEVTMLLVRKYIKYMYKYQTLEDDVHYAYSFTITRDGTDNVIITITIDGEVFTYNGSGTLGDILDSLETSILASVGHVFEVEIIDSVLYVYSYDSTLSFSTATSVSTDDEDEATIEETNIQNSYCSILLDNINCLTTEEICKIINHGYSIMESCNCN